MFLINILEKTNFLFNKNQLQFYHIFKFQCIYIILIPYISKHIYEFKLNNYRCIGFGMRVRIKPTPVLRRGVRDMSYPLPPANFMQGVPACNGAYEF